MTCPQTLKPQQTLPLLLMYWGRRGAMSRFTVEAARVARALPHVRTFVSVSRQNETFHEFASLGDDLLAVNTFASAIGALASPARCYRARRAIGEFVEKRKITVCVDLMPHIWSPLVAGAIRRSGARYCPIIHDAVPHPGDPTAAFNRIAQLAIRQADLILTLSEIERQRLERRIGAKPAVSLFHPDFGLARPSHARKRCVDRPFRLLFLGRILPYKGLSLFCEAIRLAQASGFDLEAGVFGEGRIEMDELTALDRIGAKVMNKWLSEADIAIALEHYDAVVVSHTSASQSGVVSTALGAGMPVIATPVGGIVEQIEHGVTGLIATNVSGQALAEQICRLASDPQLYDALCDTILARSGERSMPRFVERLIATVTGCATSTGRPKREEPLRR